MKTTKTEAVKQILEILQDNEDVNIALITLALRAQGLPKAVHQILKIMNDNDITVDDIIKAQRAKHPETFDLVVCDDNGKFTRVPFSTDERLNPIGICPRQKHNFFLFLDETGMVEFPDISEKSNLPDAVLCKLMMEVRPELNEKLRELGKPLLSGDYWLNGHEFSGIGYWMAKIRQDKMDEPEYWDAKHKAKVRKIGYL